MAKKKNQPQESAASAEKPAKASTHDRATSEGGRIAQFREFLEQAKVELKKIVWPTRKETIATSVAVVVVVIVMAAYLGILDGILSRVIQAILS